jgi:hypothetical protein
MPKIPDGEAFAARPIRLWTGQGARAETRLGVRQTETETGKRFSSCCCPRARFVAESSAGEQRAPGHRP